MNYSIQLQYDEIYSYFRMTSEAFDLLEWTGKILYVWSKNQIIETYSYEDLKALNIFKT